MYLKAQDSKDANVSVVDLNNLLNETLVIRSSLFKAVDTRDPRKQFYLSALELCLGISETAMSALGRSPPYSGRFERVD